MLFSWVEGEVDCWGDLKTTQWDLDFTWGGGGGWSDQILLLVCKRVNCPRQEQDQAIGEARAREPAVTFQKGSDRLEWWPRRWKEGREEKKL